MTTKTAKVLANQAAFDRMVKLFSSNKICFSTDYISNYGVIKANLGRLDLEGIGFDKLEDLSLMQDVETLDLSGNNISDIKPLLEFLNKIGKRRDHPFKNYLYLIGNPICEVDKELIERSLDQYPDWDIHF